MTLIENGMVIYQHEGNKVELWVLETIELFLKRFYGVEMLQGRRMEFDDIVYLRLHMETEKRDELKAAMLQAMFETGNINYN